MTAATHADMHVEPLNLVLFVPCPAQDCGEDPDSEFCPGMAAHYAAEVGALNANTFPEVRIRSAK